MSAYEKFANIYDRLINEDINYGSWGSFIIELCKNRNISMQEYLDAGCGTGNMALKLAPFFKSVWCVDLSEEMLIEAEEKFREKRIKAKFICQDMSKLKLNRKFDLITCVLDCTNYLTNDGELGSFFSGINDHLKENGLFIFDINSDYKLRKTLGENIFTYNSDELVYIWENSIVDNIVEMDLTFFIKENNSYQRVDELHRERIYSDAFVEETLKNNGLKLISKMDNYSNNSTSPTTERITYVVSK